MPYEIEVRHDGLHKYRHIRGNNRQVVEQKAAAQIKAWADMWENKCEIEKRRSDREKAAWGKEAKKALALQKTKEAEKSLSDIDNTLLHIFDKDCKINWEELKDYSIFNMPKPNEPYFDDLINDNIQYPEPLQSDAIYQPKFNFLHKLFPSLKKRKIDKYDSYFNQDHEKWMQIKEDILEYKNRINRWEKNKNDFIEAQKAVNEAIDKQREAYMNHDSDAIVDYSDRILSKSIYPDLFPQEYEIDYIIETKMMIVDYLLPNIDNIPKLKEVKYIQARDEYKEIYLSESFSNKIYDNLLYNIVLRSLYELFKSDISNAIDSIIFNGIVRAVDKSDGKEVTNCILSIQANKAEFMNINLSGVDPKACFKKLKGVSASKLYSLSAVAPIMKINRDDARFITAYGVADSLDDSTNIAAMDWQDFEHLIREIFEKEFNESGGEVKITQASRDGGVDAIAFDPDPLRGGKIAIQAKRYTNVVGVAAVRDLYGTVINEGASRGILVTTSEYGPDAYSFAKDKPITLLNGSNLLHLLKKHGHKAKIDLKAAKQILEKEGDR
jgi:restriction system protein